MKKVNKNFVIYRWIEITLLAAGILLLVLFRADRNKTFWLGLGLTLAIQAAIMLLADHFAAQRARVYTEQLEGFGKVNSG